MDEMVANIGREYDVGSGEQGQPPEVNNFYGLLAAADEKVHYGTDVTVLQEVTRLDTGHHTRSRVRDNGCHQCCWDLQQEGRRCLGECRRCRGDLQQEGQVRYDMYF
jgi:hypothetical protein